MGKVKDWVIEMEQDALDMSREEWTNKHGESAVEVYNKIQAELKLGEQLTEWNFGVNWNDLISICFLLRVFSNGSILDISLI